MDKKDSKSGFSGLSDLASKVSSGDTIVESVPASDAKSSTASQASPSVSKASPRSKSERKSTTCPPPIETVGRGKNGEKSDGKWILGIIAVVFVIWLLNNEGQSTKNLSYNPPPTSQNYNFPQSSPAPSTIPSVSQSTGLQYKKPPVGTDKVLSVPQIRWCIREDIRIQTMRGVFDTNAGIDGFNKVVNDYNRRCGKYRYRQSSLQRAQREVEANRSQIVSEAIRNAKRPNPQSTQEAQQLLTELGYNPGPPDGQYGHRTAGAVKEFQRDMGLKQDGWIDQELLNSLNNETNSDTMKGYLTISDESSNFLENEKEGNVFVVTGKVRNDYMSDRSFIQVKGILYDEQKNELVSKIVYAGNVPSDFKCRKLTINAIDELLNSKTGDDLSNIDVSSGIAINFKLVFDDVDEEAISYFKVFGVASQPAKK